MRAAAGRLSNHVQDGDWERMWSERRRGGHRGGPGGLRREDRNLNRLARRLEQQVTLAESLAPDVDWSFIAPDPDSIEQGSNTTSEPPQLPAQGTVEKPASASDDQTIADLENQLTDELQLVQVVAEIAEMGRRTYALEQQRELSSTRSVFFGFVLGCSDCRGMGTHRHGVPGPATVDRGAHPRHLRRGRPRLRLGAASAEGSPGRN